MIELKSGNFFDYEADIRINTVNCVGAMGAGVALQFKNLFPQMFAEYKNLCLHNKLRTGSLHIWHSKDIFKNLTIINFPTKDHWKEPSKYEYIVDGLVSLQKYLQFIEPKTITIPALGCGHGGLDWETVKPMIYEKLSSLNHKILLFAPESSQNTSSYNNKELLEENKIHFVAPHDILFPNKLKGKTSKTVFYSGNLQLLNSRILNLISSKKPTEKEKYVLFEILNEFKKNNSIFSVLLSGDKSYEIDIVKFLLENGINTILNPSKGLLNFKLRNDIKPLLNDYNYLVYNSIKNQNDNWNVTNFTSNYKESYLISDIDLFNISDEEEITNLLKNSGSTKKIYYINYFNRPLNINKEKNSFETIGRNRHGYPNVQKILS